MEEEEETDEGEAGRRVMKVSTVRVEVDQAIRGGTSATVLRMQISPKECSISMHISYLFKHGARRKVAHRSSSRDIFLSLDHFDTNALALVVSQKFCLHFVILNN